MPYNFVSLTSTLFQFIFEYLKLFILFNKNHKNSFSIYSYNKGWILNKYEQKWWKT